MNKNAADFDEARWRRLTDADAVEEPLSEADREFLEGFTPRSAPAKAEAELFSTLARLGEGDWQDEEAANSPLVDATVQHVFAARIHATAARGSAPTSAKRRWTVTGLAVAAAVVIATWLGTRASEPVSEGGGAQVVQAQGVQETASPSRPAPASTVAEPEPESVVAPERVRVASGSLLDAEGQSLVAEAAVSGVVTVDSDRGCVGVERTTACFRQGSRLDVHEQEPHITIMEGEGTIDAPGPIVGGALTVEIAGERYDVSSPVTMETAVYDLRRARVEVTRGEVEVRDAEGAAHVLKAGAVRGRTKPAAVQPPDAKTLLAKARASRSAGDRAAAISHYESLVRHHADLPASHAAMVSLGDLYLDTRKPATALEWFQRYLDRGAGALAQEAYIGRIKALQALGREAQLQQAIEAFRERYPSSRYADQLGKPTP